MLRLRGGEPVYPNPYALTLTVSHRLRDREPVLLLELMDHRRVRLLPRTG